MFRDVPLFGFNQSGGSYLTNMLLELELCTYSFDLAWGWETTDHVHYRLREQYRNYLGFLYPRLMEQTDFVFRDGTGVRYTHRLPRPADGSGPALLLVRDPRGVLQSIHDRFADGRDLHEHLQGNLHRDGPRIEPFRLFGLYPLECWALYYALTLDLMPREALHVARFEELKADPVAGVHALLAHLGLARDDEEIRAAHARSSRTAVAQATEAWRARYPDQIDDAKCLKRGQTDAWGDAWAGRLGGLTGLVLARLGYGGAESGTARRLAVDPTLAECDPAAYARAVQATARRDDLESALEVGLGLAACRQAREWLGSGSPWLGRATRRLVELYAWLEGKPLHLLLAARAAGDPALLALAAEEARTFGETVEVAVALLEAGDEAAAVDRMDRARASVAADRWSTWVRRVEERAPQGDAPWQEPARRAAALLAGRQLV